MIYASARRPSHDIKEKSQKGPVGLVPRRRIRNDSHMLSKLVKFVTPNDEKKCIDRVILRDFRKFFLKKHLVLRLNHSRNDIIFLKKVAKTSLCRS